MPFIEEFKIESTKQNETQILSLENTGRHLIRVMEFRRTNNAKLLEERPHLAGSYQRVTYEIWACFNMEAAQKPEAAAYVNPDLAAFLKKLEEKGCRFCWEPSNMKPLHITNGYRNISKPSGGYFTENEKYHELPGARLHIDDEHGFIYPDFLPIFTEAAGLPKAQLDRIMSMFATGVYQAPSAAEAAEPEAGARAAAASGRERFGLLGAGEKGKAAALSKLDGMVEITQLVAELDKLNPDNGMELALRMLRNAVEDARTHAACP